MTWQPTSRSAQGRAAKHPDRCMLRRGMTLMVGHAIQLYTFSRRSMAARVSSSTRPAPLPQLPATCSPARGWCSSSWQRSAICAASSESSAPSNICALLCCLRHQCSPGHVLQKPSQTAPVWRPMALHRMCSICTPAMPIAVFSALPSLEHICRTPSRVLEQQRLLAQGC